MWLRLKGGSEVACPLQREIEVIHPKEQEQAISGCPVIGARQRRMIVRAPLVEAQQHRSI